MVAVLLVAVALVQALVAARPRAQGLGPGLYIPHLRPAAELPRPRPRPRHHNCEDDHDHVKRRCKSVRSKRHLTRLRRKQKRPERQERTIIISRELNTSIVPNMASDACVNLDFGNVTKWSNKTWRYVQRNSGVMFGAVEHRMNAKQAAEAAEKMKTLGWRSWWAPAVMTDKNSTSGGAKIAFSTTVRSSSMIGLLAEVDSRASCSSGVTTYGEGWTAAIMHARNLRVLVVVVYFTCGIGPTGDNLRKLSKIQALLSTMRMVYLIIADWHFPPVPSSTRDGPLILMIRCLCPT